MEQPLLNQNAQYDRAETNPPVGYVGIQILATVFKCTVNKNFAKYFVFYCKFKGILVISSNIYIFICIQYDNNDNAYIHISANIVL